jgi:hypothetical protein
MQKTDMSDRDDSDDIITNQETRTRRDWVARALASVRRRLERGEELSPERDRRAVPRLYVVPPGRKR